MTRVDTVVRLRDDGSGERAIVDGRTVVPRSGESPREAALRIATAGLERGTRLIRIESQNGTRLFVRAEPGGRLVVLDANAPPLWPGRDEPWAVPDAAASTPGTCEPEAPVGPPGTSAEVDDPPGEGLSDHRPHASPGRPHRPTDRSPDADPPTAWALWPVSPPVSSSLVSRWRSAQRWRWLTARNWLPSLPTFTPPSVPELSVPRLSCRRVRMPRPVLTSAGRGRLFVVAWLVLSLVVVVGSAAGLTALLRPRVETSAMAFDGDPPDGWSATSRWTSPILAPSTRVAVLDEGVAIATASHRLALVDAATGAVRWHRPLPDGTDVSGPFPARVDDRPVILVRVGDTVRWWTPDGDPVGTVRLPQGTEVTYDGPVPLVLLPGGRAAVLRDGELRHVTVPDGARAVLARADGAVTAAASSGWWHLTPGAPAGEAAPWEPPAARADLPPTDPVVVGALGSAVVLLYPPSGDAVGIVVVHHDGDEVRASFQGPFIAGPSATWDVSDSTDWGVLGRTLVDVRHGRMADLGTWRSVLVGNDRVYGLLDGRLHVAGPGVDPTTVHVQTALVEAVTPAGAVVRVNHEGAELVHLLPRAE